MTPEQSAEWLAWVEQRPPEVRAVVERLPPWGVYRLTTTGQLCRIQSYDEPEDGGPCTVTIVAWYEWMPFFPRGVFGVNPDELQLAVAGDDA
jgi:hypothetical protein